MSTQSIDCFNEKMEKLRIQTEKETKRKMLIEEMEELAKIQILEESKENLRTEENPSFGPPLFHRVMRKVHPQGLEHYNAGSSFKIMSYNITSDRILEQTATHLSKDDPVHNPIYRMRRILQEIEQSCPDILCMQEVSTRTAYPFLAKELEDMNYEVIAPKQAEAFMKDEYFKQHPRYHDLLTAFRKDKFQLVEKKELDYYNVALNYQNSADCNDFKKSNKAILLLLNSTDNVNDFVTVVNTQLYHGDE